MIMTKTSNYFIIFNLKLQENICFKLKKSVKMSKNRIYCQITQKIDSLLLKT